MRPRVFVVQPIPEPALELMREVADVTVYPHLDRQISTDELIANVRRCDYLFALPDTIIPAEVVNANCDLKGIVIVVSRQTNLNIDLDAARERRLPIATVTPAEEMYQLTCKATCDLAMALILDLAYRVVESDRYSRCGKFKQEETLALMGQGCLGKTVGLIGLGRIGAMMLPRIHAFEMQAIYHKRNRLPPREEERLGVEWVPSKEELLKHSDFVTLQCDYNPSTHLLIGARELSLMKPTAYLINTARGRLVDERALVRALETGAIAGAGLDVFWSEPPVAHDPAPSVELYKLPNVVLTPHNGGATWYVRGERTKSAARTIVAMIKGEPVPGLIYPV